MSGRALQAALPLAVVFVLGCNNEKVAIQPTPTPSLVEPAARETPVGGNVIDTAFRPLGGVRVEVADGPRAGTFATTDDTGRFSMPGAFLPGSMTVAASKDGYLASTQTLTIRQGQQQAGVTFLLELSSPSVNLAGEYVLTLTADANSNCTNLPAEARARTYTATIARGARPTFFQGTLTGATFVGRFNAFYVGVAGDFGSFSLDDFCSPSIVEALDNGGYLAIDAEGTGIVGASGTTIALNGYIQYCPPDKALISGDRYQCSTVTPVTSVTCVSRNHRLTLTRR